MLSTFKSAAKFVTVMFVLTIACTIVWQNVASEYLYDNSDENMLGFLNPFSLQGWIGQGNFPVMVVDHVVHGRSMSEPDEIKAGWSIPKLWCLWFSLVTASVWLSFFLARVGWTSAVFGHLLPRMRWMEKYETPRVDEESDAV